MPNILNTNWYLLRINCLNKNVHTISPFSLRNYYKTIPIEKLTTITLIVDVVNKPLGYMLLVIIYDILVFMLHNYSTHKYNNCVINIKFYHLSNFLCISWLLNNIAICVHYIIVSFLGIVYRMQCGKQFDAKNDIVMLLGNDSQIKAMAANMKARKLKAKEEKVFCYIFIYYFYIL